MKKFKWCLLLLFPVLLHPARATDASDFFFTKVIEQTPYIIISDMDLVNWFELSLSKNALHGIVELDSTDVEKIHGLGLYYTGELPDTTSCYRLLLSACCGSSV